METTQQKAVRLLVTKIQSSRNDRAHKACVPKAFRQHAERYGTGVDALIQEHKKHPRA